LGRVGGVIATKRRDFAYSTYSISGYSLIACRLSNRRNGHFRAWFIRIEGWLTPFGLLAAITLARSTSEGPGYPRWRFGLVGPVVTLS